MRVFQKSEDEDPQKNPMIPQEILKAPPKILRVPQENFEESSELFDNHQKVLIYIYNGKMLIKDQFLLQHISPVRIFCTQKTLPIFSAQIATVFCGYHRRL